MPQLRLMPGRSEPLSSCDGAHLTGVCGEEVGSIKVAAHPVQAAANAPAFHRAVVYALRADQAVVLMLRP